MAGYELGIIGGGRMAEAIIHGLIDSIVLSRNIIVISDPDPARRQHLANEMRLVCVPQNTTPAACPCVLLTVKPRVMGKVLREIAPTVRKDALVISIAAGVTTQFLDEGLGRRGHIVRVMPNTPILIGAGMSVLCAGPRADEHDLKHAEKIFAACGKTVIVDEGMMDAAAAVSESGPAYLIYLVEAMIQAGINEGLTWEIARALAIQTCFGAAKLLSESKERPDVLRMQLTEPGSPTQRATETLDAAGVKESLIAAVRAAAREITNSG